jgi:DNA replication protein DnaC
MTRWQIKWLKLDAHHPKLSEMADAVQRLAFGWYRNSFSERHLLVLVGRTGCGKTHCARRLAAWARYVGVSAWEAGWWPDVPNVSYTAWTEACDDFSRDPKANIMGDLTTQTLLVLDDVGAEVDRWKTGEMNVKLQMVLDRRTKLWTAITTNVEPSRWSARWDERIADRLLRDSIVCDVSEVESYQTRKV